MAEHKHYDIADNMIRPGDFVLYAALWDRSATLKYGIVTRLAERGDSYLDDRVRYTVRVITVDRSAKYENGKKLGVVWELQKEGKEVALGFLDRMLVVPRDQVPPQARKALDEAAKGKIQ